MGEEITSFIGTEVYSKSGARLGEVEDVQINSKTKEISGLALIDLNKEIFKDQKQGAIIPYKWVRAVGDIIIIRDIVEKLKKEMRETS